MGKLTEYLSAIQTPAADLNRELYSHIDLDAENDAIIKARAMSKKARKQSATLFALE